MHSPATSAVMNRSPKPVPCTQGLLLLVALLLFAPLSLVGCEGAPPAGPTDSDPTESHRVVVDGPHQDAAASFDAASLDAAPPLASELPSSVSAEAEVTAAVSSPSANAPDADVAPGSVCDKYGGAEAVRKVVSDFVVPALVQDCRINAYFAALTEPGVQRVDECLGIQVQELFGCEGVTYAGSHASNGLPCRSMAKAHIGLQISQGDFDALIEDVVSALSAAGVTTEDIGLAAPALLGMQADIVEQPTSVPALNACQ